MLLFIIRNYWWSHDLYFWLWENKMSNWYVTLVFSWLHLSSRWECANQISHTAGLLMLIHTVFICVEWRCFSVLWNVVLSTIRALLNGHLHVDTSGWVVFPSSAQCHRILLQKLEILATKLAEWSWYEKIIVHNWVVACTPSLFGLQMELWGELWGPHKSTGSDARGSQAGPT